MSGIKERLKRITPLYRCWHNARVEFNKIREKNKVRSYQKYGHDALADISKAIIESEINCVCMYGTLLGLIRDGKLIPWDDDLDFIIIDTPEFSWDKLDIALRKAGFWKYRESDTDGKKMACSYKKKGVLCDFSVWKNCDVNVERTYGCYQNPSYHYDNAKPGKYRSWKYIAAPIRGIERINCSGIEVTVPSNYEEVLEAVYGKCWRIPDPDYIMNREEIEIERTITYYRKPLICR